MQHAAPSSRAAELTAGRRADARQALRQAAWSRTARRASPGRRQLQTRALLAEVDLPAALTSLQDALQHAPHAAAAAALALGGGGAEGAVLAAAASSSSVASASAAWSSLLGQHELQHLMALADVAAQRIADLAEAAALGAADPAGAVLSGGKAPADNGWLQPLVTGLETVLQYIQDGLDRVSVPYSYGWSIVTLTLCVKLATFPLTKKQVESSLNMQALKPQIEAIKAQYGDNKEAVQRETSALYEKAGVDPLAGCLPSVATIPIFIGLYRSLSDFASRDEAGAAAFYWIPSLAGPTSVAAQKAGAGTAWLFPLVDGVPPIGSWDLAARYVALPLALVVVQFISNSIVQPPQTDDSDSAKVTQGIVKLLPLMIGWFALNVPSGLSLYYFANTLFTTGQQVYLKKLGGASLLAYDLGPIELGKARRTGTSVAEDTLSSSDEGGAAVVAMSDGSAAGNGAAAEAQLAATAVAAAAAPAEPKINRRCKRRRRELLELSA